jgi:hypothetical protein
MNEHQPAPWAGIRPTSTREPSSAWERMLKVLCECHVFSGTWAGDEKALQAPDTHDDYCPAARADKMRDDVRDDMLAGLTDAEGDPGDPLEELDAERIAANPNLPALMAAARKRRAEAPARREDDLMPRLQRTPRKLPSA